MSIGKNNDFLEGTPL